MAETDTLTQSKITSVDQAPTDPNYSPIKQQPNVPTIRITPVLKAGEDTKITPVPGTHNETNVNININDDKPKIITSTTTAHSTKTSIRNGEQLSETLKNNKWLWAVAAILLIVIVGLVASVFAGSRQSGAPVATTPETIDTATIAENPAPVTSTPTTATRLPTAFDTITPACTVTMNPETTEDRHKKARWSLWYDDRDCPENNAYQLLYTNTDDNGVEHEIRLLSTNNYHATTIQNFDIYYDNELVFQTGDKYTALQPDDEVTVNSVGIYQMAGDQLFIYFYTWTSYYDGYIMLDNQGNLTASNFTRGMSLIDEYYDKFTYWMYDDVYNQMIKAGSEFYCKSHEDDMAQIITRHYQVGINTDGGTTAPVEVGNPTTLGDTCESYL